MMTTRMSTVVSFAVGTWQLAISTPSWDFLLSALSDMLGMPGEVLHRNIIGINTTKENNPVIICFVLIMSTELCVLCSHN